MPKGARSSIIKIIAAVILIIAVNSIAAKTDLGATFVYLEGLSSWYSESDPGILSTTANMEKFDEDGMTCAIWGVPFNTIVEVANMKNGRIVNVRVNDRGPAKRLCKEGRVIDLTKGAFKKIGSLDGGLTKVRVRIPGGNDPTKQK